MKTGNTALATEYKNKLMNAFPESDYAVAVADPNYEYNIRMMDVVQDSIYQATYDRYLESDTAYVRKSFRYVSEKYPLATLMPKFMFLDALSYVQAGDAEGFKNALKALVEKYPNADVTELAGEMLKGVLRGRALVQGGVKGMSWNLRFGLGEDGMLSAEDSARVFNPERNTPYQMLLVYPTGSVDQNQLLFAVAAYNFANFMVKEFDLALEQAGPISMLAIKGFISFDEIIQYYKMIYGKDGYATALNKAVAVLPISDDNYETLMRGKTLDEYITFFDESFGEELPDLAGRWKARMEAAKEEEATEDEMITEEEAEVPEKADELKPEVEPEKQPVTEPEEEQRSVQEPVRQLAMPVVPDTIEVPAFDKPEIQRVDTLRKDTVPVVQPAVEDQGMTLKEIQEIRKREAAEEEARKEEARKAFEAQQKADKELREQKAKEQEELLKKQAEEERALLKAKADREKQLEADRKAKLKQAEADRKAKLKAREDLRKEKERAYKQQQKIEELKSNETDIENIDVADFTYEDEEVDAVEEHSQDTLFEKENTVEEKEVDEMEELARIAKQNRKEKTAADVKEYTSKFESMADASNKQEEPQVSKPKKEKVEEEKKPVEVKKFNYEDMKPIYSEEELAEIEEQEYEDENAWDDDVDYEEYDEYYDD